MLWISPLISTVLSVLYSLIVMPSLLTIAEGSIFWMVTIPLQLVITITFTGIAYIISRLLKKEYRKTNK
jgi:O-antigen/teichoic acid export membrane protein